MAKLTICILIIFAATGPTWADDTDYESTWKDPSARFIDLRGNKMASFLLSRDEAVRRGFEYNLALELRKKGISAVPGYEVLPRTDVTNKEEILAGLSNTDAKYAMFMRIVDREKEVHYSPGSVWYPGPFYDHYWYGGFGWPPYYDPGHYWVDTIISVETLVYRVPDGKLIWTGLSRTVNPDEIDDFAEDLASETIDELEDMGVIKERT
jgi:hypothetical protein